MGNSDGHLHLSLGPVCAVSVIGMAITFCILPRFREMFIRAGLFGIDLCKRKPEKISEQIKVPESAGVISGTVFLMISFVLIPLAFSDYFGVESSLFPHVAFVQLVTALLSITCMLLLGFVDDVLDLKWRHKLLLPTLASLPLLMVYYVTENRTDIVMPIILRPIFGTNVDLSYLYYVFMGLLAIFCTNAINILAGINGLETGQSLVIAFSVAVFNFYEMNGPLGHYHRFSLYFLLPYMATTLPLFYYNWCPAQVFVGDTFCYFSGMTLAVVAILGHFSKTLLLFFIPQVANFLYSVPQLFHLIPCPRHRLPRYNPDLDMVEPSRTMFKPSQLNSLGKLALYMLRLFRLVDYHEYRKDDETYAEMNNLTLINFALITLGAKRESHLTTILLLLQVFCTLIAFLVRYPLAFLCYGEIIA